MKAEMQASGCGFRMVQAMKFWRPQLCNIVVACFRWGGCIFGHAFFHEFEQEFKNDEGCRLSVNMSFAGLVDIPQALVKEPGSGSF